MKKFYTISEVSKKLNLINKKFKTTKSYFEILGKGVYAN